jgi:hypothetical protein
VAQPTTPETQRNSTPIIVEGGGSFIGKWVEEELAPALIEAERRGVSISSLEVR